MIRKEIQLPIWTGEQSGYRQFEGVKIQWEKMKWEFETPEKNTILIDTYSIWNYNHHGEIANRLALGQRCAIYMMGNYGVGEIRGFEQKQKEDTLFEKVKQRDRMQTLVAFTHPDELQEIIDYKRLPEEFKDIEDPQKRLTLFPGPMHIILPVNEEKLPDLGIKRETNEAAFFWIPGHKGYEELANTLKKSRVEGFIAGGSLNIHGQKPCFTTDELKNREMAKHREWQENIDFVILDEISESANIARSHTQVSFMQNPPTVLRLGSMSEGKISRETGYKVDLDRKSIKYASSNTPYTNIYNLDSDRKVEIALARMARYHKSLSRGGRLSGPEI